MAAPKLQVVLSPESDQTLLELKRAMTVPQRTRERAEALRLNHRGWTAEQIAEYLGWQVATVRKTIHRWQEKGLSGLWDAPRSGRPRGWENADLAHVTAVIEERPESFNSRQLVEELFEARGVRLSRRHLRRLLKKKLSVETDTSEPSQSARPD